MNGSRPFAADSQALQDALALLAFADEEASPQHWLGVGLVARRCHGHIEESIWIVGQEVNDEPCQFIRKAIKSGRHDLVRKFDV